MKIFLDDERITPEGWIRTYSVEETIEYLKTRQVTHLSCDNDLGSLDVKTEGFNVLNWLEQEVFNDPSFPVPEITIHSSNASRVKSMLATIDSINRLKL
jgi:hypothetical protein